jgi:hypothetical protein
MQLRSSEVTVCFYGTSLINGALAKIFFARPSGASRLGTASKKSSLCHPPLCVRSSVCVYFVSPSVVSSNYVIGSAAESRLRAPNSVNVVLMELPHSSFFPFNTSISFSDKHTAFCVALQASVRRARKSVTWNEMEFHSAYFSI